jgi:hypothetical protein
MWLARLTEHRTTVYAVPARLLSHRRWGWVVATASTSRPYGKGCCRGPLSFDPPGEPHVTCASNIPIFFLCQVIN